MGYNESEGIKAPSNKESVSAELLRLWRRQHGNLRKRECQLTGVTDHDTLQNSRKPG